MPRSKQQLPTANAPSGFGAAEHVEIQQLVEELDGMLNRLRLGAIREQLDGLLEEAGRRQLNLREALAWLCAAEVASKEQRRLSMALTIAHFPFVRTLEGFEFEAQPSIDPGKIRDLATCRWVANGDNVVLLGPPGVGKTHLEVALGREAAHSRARTASGTGSWRGRMCSSRTWPLVQRRGRASGPRRCGPNTPA